MAHDLAHDLDGVRSERQLIEPAPLNLAHHWHLGYALDEDLPDHSSRCGVRSRPPCSPTTCVDASGLKPGVAGSTGTFCGGCEKCSAGQLCCNDAA